MNAPRQPVVKRRITRVDSMHLFLAQQQSRCPLSDTFLGQQTIAKFMRKITSNTVLFSWASIIARVLFSPSAHGLRNEMQFIGYLA